METKTRKKKKRATVCLCMMVKNEERVIRRALDSALPHVDAWSIVDTGSTDGTLDIIEEVLGDMPGLVSRMDWVDFGTNRTLAFNAARALGTDYILVMDADQTLEVLDPDWKLGLGKDGYNIQILHSTISYPHPWLLRARKDWRWIGATHEYLHCDEPYEYATFGGIRLIEHSDSHRRRTGAKLTEDAALLAAAAEADPKDPRTQFYLGQACADVGDYAGALEHYQRRVGLGGWVEECWCAQYRIGRIHETARDWAKAVEAYLIAFNMDPSRAEPLYRIARGELAHGRFTTAYHFFTGADGIAKPDNRLFLEDAVYDYASLWGRAMALRLLGRHAEGAADEEVVLASGKAPPQVVAAIRESRESRSIGVLPI